MQIILPKIRFKDERIYDAGNNFSNIYNSFVR